MTAAAMSMLAMALFTSTVIADDMDASVRDENGCSAWNPLPQSSPSFRWTGLCKDGWLDGSGTIEWLAAGQTIETMATTMRRGRASGFTRDQVLEQRVVVQIVEADYANGRANGYGQWRDIRSYVRYLGFFDEGKFEGLGTLFRADGSRIDGQFHGGLLNGFAMETAADGRMVLGSTSGGVFSGPAIVYPSRSARIETTFKNGQVPPGTACRQFAPNGANYLGTVTISPPTGPISCTPSPAVKVAEFSRAAADAINAVASAHGYSPKATPINPYAYVDHVVREQSARIQSHEAEFAALADKDAVPLPDSCLRDTTYNHGRTSTVEFQNRCDALINVNICVRIDGEGNTQRLKQQVAPNSIARLEFANPHRAPYLYEYRYCRPDRTQAVDSCLSSCPDD